MIISQPQRFLIAIGVAALAVMLTAFFANPLFATNDDVAIAMIGAGFGMAAHPEPHLVYSHYGYGLLLNGLSHIVGPRAHGLVTLLAVGFSLGLCAYAMGKRPAFLLTGVLVAGGSIYANALLAPQFTITSGVLVAAGVACYIASTRRDELSPFLLACIYFAVVLGGLIRPASAIAVCIVCAPLLIWIALKGQQDERRGIRYLIVSLCILGGMSLTLEWAAYYFSDDWSQVLEYNFTRALFNDFFRVPWVPDAPAYKAAGWSENDYLMFKDWFAQHDIYSFEKITSIAASVATQGPVANVEQIFAAFGRLVTNPQVTAILSCQLILLFVFGQSRIVLLLLLIGVVLAVLLSASTGRPPQDRVLIMIAATGLILGLAQVGVQTCNEKIQWRQGISLSFAALLSLGIGLHTLWQHRTTVRASVAYRTKLTSAKYYVEGRTIGWGASLTWEWLVTPTQIYPPVLNRVIPSIGALSRTPITDAALIELGIRDLGKALCLDSDIRIIAQPRSIRQLETFCEERYQSRPGYRLVYSQAPRTRIYARAE